jgi:hypothetical protein
MSESSQPTPTQVAALGTLKCPRCKKTWRAGHPCEGDGQ